MIMLDLQITVSALIKFLIKFVIIIILIWLGAVITPKLSGKTDGIISKFKKNKKDSSIDENIYKTDVFGASIKDDTDDNKKNKEN